MEIILFAQTERTVQYLNCPILSPSLFEGYQRLTPWLRQSNNIDWRKQEFRLESAHILNLSWEQETFVRQVRLVTHRWFWDFATFAAWNLVGLSASVHLLLLPEPAGQECRRPPSRLEPRGASQGLSGPLRASLSLSGPLTERLRASQSDSEPLRGLFGALGGPWKRPGAFRVLGLEKSDENAARSRSCLGPRHV